MKKTLEKLLIKFFDWLLQIHLKSIIKIIEKNKLIFFYIFLLNFKEKYPTKPIDTNLAINVMDKLFPSKEPFKLTFNSYDDISVYCETKFYLKKDEVKNLIENHFLLLIYYYDFFDKKQSEKIGKILKEINSDIKYLTHTTYSILRKKIIKKYKNIFKYYREQSKTGNLKDKTHKRISISISEIKSIFSIASILFFISGFIYNKLLLNYFGIEVSNFFTISDYISTSIEQIYFNIIPLFISIVINLFWWSPEYIKRRQKMSEKRLFFEDLPFFLMILLFTISAIFLSYKDLPLKYLMIGINIFIVLQYFIPKAYIFFKNPKYFHLVTSYIIIFLIFLTSQALEKGKMIKKYYKNQNYFIKFDDSIKINPKKIYLITSNSNYSFFYHRDNNKTYIISNKHIRYFTKKGFSEKNFFDNLIDIIIPLKNQKN